MRSVILFLLLFSNLSYATVTDSVDRFTGTREINAVNRPTAVNRLFLSAFVKIFKQSLQEPPLITLILSQVHHGSQYTDCHSVDWLADGQGFTTRVAKHEASEVKDGYVIEQIIFGDVPEADFRKIAAANKVEYRICGDVFTLAPAEASDVRQVVGLMSSTSKP